MHIGLNRFAAMLLSRLISAGLFGDVIKALKPLMDIWGALGDDAILRLQHVAEFHLLTVPSISQGSFLKLLGQASAVRDRHTCKISARIKR